MFYFRELVYPAVLYIFLTERKHPEKNRIPLSNFAAQSRRFWNLSIFNSRLISDPRDSECNIKFEHIFAGTTVQFFQSIMRARPITVEYIENGHFGSYQLWFEPKKMKNKNLALIEIGLEGYVSAVFITNATSNVLLEIDKKLLNIRDELVYKYSERYETKVRIPKLPFDWIYLDETWILR